MALFRNACSSIVFANVSLSYHLCPPFLTIDEPIPYRSAVEKGATHVLALRSRPDGCLVPTKPATYEKIVAPVYFRLSFLPMVGDFFERQGSQYRYLEDVLTLDEGLVKGCEKSSSPDFDGVRVPPTEILLGTENARQARCRTFQSQFGRPR